MDSNHVSESCKTLCQSSFYKFCQSQMCDAETKHSKLFPWFNSDHCKLIHEYPKRVLSTYLYLRIEVKCGINEKKDS